MVSKRILFLALVLVLLLVAAVPAAADTSALIRTRVQDNRFRPRSNMGTAADTYGWKNFGPSVHTVTSYDGLFDSGDMSVNEIFSVTGLAPGTYNYFCVYHEALGMTGRIIVNP